jgi:hypothetical protein
MFLLCREQLRDSFAFFQMRLISTRIAIPTSCYDIRSITAAAANGPNVINRCVYALLDRTRTPVTPMVLRNEEFM